MRMTSPDHSTICTKVAAMPRQSGVTVLQSSNPFSQITIMQTAEIVQFESWHQDVQTVVIILISVVKPEMSAGDVSLQSTARVDHSQLMPA